jgi:macrolide transport system ATP-binding/permease protein
MGWMQRLRAQFRQETHSADLHEELQFHLAMREQTNAEAGMSKEEAYRQARIRMGNVTRLKEQMRQIDLLTLPRSLWLDARYAIRQLRRSPGFSLVAVATLALGIGATTAIFTLIYDVMLRPLPFAQADRIVNIEEITAEWRNLYPALPVNANHFTSWQRNSRSFDSLAVMQQGSAPLGGEGRPRQVGVLAATPGIFSVLRVQPRLGRAFTASEAQPGSEHVAILMYDFWREQFGSDPGIVGRTIRLSGFPYTVIGVMPQSFHMPAVQTLAAVGNRRRPLSIAILEPLAFSRERLAEEMGDFNYFGLGRLKPGVSVAAATADLDALQHTIGANLPADVKATLSVKLTPFQEELVGNNRKPLIILLVAVAGLLLVGCVNVMNLLLARAVGQKQQTAVAAALGASRAELLRMALRETALLAATGGGLGVLLASAIVPAMRRYLPPALDFRGPLHLDWVGAACASFLAAMTTLLAGAAPALMVSRTAPHEVLHSESRLAGESRGTRRMRRMLVGIEVAVSVALVLMTGLLTASLAKLMHVDRGFTTARTITATIDLPAKSYPDLQHRAAFYRQVLQRLEGLPGVEHAALTSVLPLTGDSWGDMARVAGDNRPVTQLPIESFRSVSPEYFSTIRLRFISGHSFSQSDWGKNLAVVTEKTAKTLWPGVDPIGKQFSRGDPDRKDKPFTVAGVIANARTITLAKPDPMMIYVPYWYRCDPLGGLVVRTRQDPAEMADAMRRTVWSVDRGVPVPTLRTMGTLVADSVANQRFEMDLLFLFAASALLLAGLGVYGVVMYSVVRRYREIGLRIALGAQRASVYRLVLRDGLTPVAAGALAGVALSFASSRMISNLLYQVSPHDPGLTAGAVCVLLVIGTVACLLPARRAASVEPMEALRTE